MTDYPFEKLEERYRTIPPDIRKAISSKKMAEALSQIAKRHKVHFDKIDDLFDETGLVMLGLTRPEAFIRNLIKRLEIGEETARAIAQDINSEVFRPIRESLKEMYKISGDGTAQKPVTPQKQTLEETPEGRQLPAGEQAIKEDPQIAKMSHQPVEKVTKPPYKLGEVFTVNTAGVHIEKSSTAPAAPDEPTVTEPKKSSLQDEINKSFPVTHEDLNRDQMLHEIENPETIMARTGVKNPFTKPAQEISGAPSIVPPPVPQTTSPKEDIPSPKTVEQKAIKKEWEGSLDTLKEQIDVGRVSTPTIIEEKLNAMFKMPGEKSAYTIKPSEQKQESTSTEQKNKYEADPYREPIE